MKKQYKKPEMKEVKLKHRAGLLEGSGNATMNNGNFAQNAFDEGNYRV